MANVYLKIEIKQRELLSRILIGMYSAINGNTIYVGNIHNYLERNKLSPGIFLDKSISRTKSKLKKLENYVKNGNIVTSIDEECGVTHSNLDSFITLRFSPQTLKNTSAIFCWGHLDYNYLKKKYPKFKEKFFITGSARVDVCEILKKIDNKKRLRFLPNKKYAVISSNFGSILTKKPLWKTLKDRKNYYKDEKKKNLINTETEDFRFGRDIWKTTILKEYLNLIKDLSLSIKDINFIIRPHPSEIKLLWQAILDENLKNVFVLDDYSSSEVINFAEFMIHSGCHTALEAKFMDTPVISFIPLKDQKFERKFYNKCGKELLKKKDIINFIKTKKYKKKILNKKFEKEVSYKFFKKKNTLSSIEISKVIQRLIKNSDLNKYEDSFKNKLFLFVLKYKQLVQNFFNSKKDEKNFEHKFNNLTFREVNEIIEIYKSYDDNLKNIKFKLMNKRILKIWND